MHPPRCLRSRQSRWRLISETQTTHRLPAGSLSRPLYRARPAGFQTIEVAIFGRLVGRGARGGHRRCIAIGQIAGLSQGSAEVTGSKMPTALAWRNAQRLSSSLGRLALLLFWLRRRRFRSGRRSGAGGWCSLFLLLFLLRRSLLSCGRSLICGLLRAGV